MDLETQTSIVKTVWNLELDKSKNTTLESYSQYYYAQIGYNEPEVSFFTGLLKSNISSSRSELQNGVESLIASWGNPASQVPSGAGSRVSHTPVVGNDVKAAMTRPGFKVDAALAQAVRIVFAVDLAMSTREIMGHSMTVWDNSKSLQTVMTDIFPRFRMPNARNYTPDPQPSTQIKRVKLCAKYLKDHASVELVWTKHLPDHLELDGKTLRVFEIVSLLELQYEVVDNSRTELSDCLQQGCFQPDFIVETLMTITLLFPPKDREWLKSLIKPHRQWPEWWKKTPQLDERLSTPFDTQLFQDNEKYRRPINNTQALFELYPNWASRLLAIYEEAEDPSPSTAIGKWAEQRRGPRHTYWVTVAGFILAISFGLAATILGALQFWVGYCQWKMPEGGGACGPRHSHDSSD